jgi:Papain family cysteine protease
MSTPNPPAGHLVYRRPIPETIVPGHRLGRHIKRDSRSLAYPYQARRTQAQLADQLWTRTIPILDQGDVGSCTGNAITGLLGTAPFAAALPADHPALNEALALVFYSQGEDIDGDGPYPPNDNGSTGSSVAQAAKNDGDISGYTHATSATDMADALQDGPVIVGVDWYSSFDTPNSAGLIKIAKGAYVRGGHEFVVRGCQVASKLFLADNSWGTSYGSQGSMEFSWDTMDQLFAAQGDCTVCVPLTAPAPVPVPVDDPNAVLAAVLSKANAKGQRWVDQRHEQYVETVAKAGATWLAATGL